MPDPHTKSDHDQPAAPGSVSDQNREEAEPGLYDRLQERSEDTGKAEDRGEHKDDSDGDLSEGSQAATGHPNNAG
jgi:hypothetical protein